MSNSKVLIVAAMLCTNSQAQQLHEAKLNELRRTNPMAATVATEIYGQMLRIPNGAFEMGSRFSNEKPRHRVNIKSFKLSKYEVTFAQYDVFAMSTKKPLPYDEGWGREQRPAINVSWEDAQAFAKWLTEISGVKYRLPSEAEWEYAARGGTTTEFFWGKVPMDSKNYANIIQMPPNLGRDDWEFTAPVGQLQANPFGVYDIVGNVFEWTLDCYQPTFDSAPTDGSSSQSSDCSNRVIRGGSHKGILANVRSSQRMYKPLSTRADDIGFRLVAVE